MQLNITCLLSLALLLPATAEVNCTYCKGAWEGKCGKYEGVLLRVIMRNHKNLMDPFASIGADFKECTGATVSITPVAMSKWEMAVRDDVTNLMLHDGYVMKPIWWQTNADKFETLNEYIRKTDPSFNYNDIYPVLRNRLSQAGGETKTLAIDADWSLPFVRRDLIERHGKNIPETWEEFADLAEYFQGKDLNGDGEPDFGSCFDTDSRIDAMLFAVVAPYLQAQTKDKNQGVFFDAETFETLFDNPGYLAALRVFKRIVDASTFAELGPRDSKGETRVFDSGRCVMYVQRPGVLKSTMMKSIKWPMNNSGVVYHPQAMKRIKPPGTTKVLNRATNTLDECTKSAMAPTGKITCPWATTGARHALVNRAPFFWSGGMAFAIRANADVTAKKALWDLFAYINSPDISTSFVMKKGLYDAFRESHLKQELIPKYLAAGWKTEEAVRDHFEISGWALSEEANAVFDMTIPNGQDYLKKIKATTVEYFGWRKAGEGETADPFELPLADSKVWKAEVITRGRYVGTSWKFPLTEVWVKGNDVLCGLLIRADGADTGLLAAGAVTAGTPVTISPADLSQYRCKPNNFESRGYVKIPAAQRMTEAQYIAKLKKGSKEQNAAMGTADKAIKGDGGALYGAYQQLKVYRSNLNLDPMTKTDECGTVTNAKFFEAANLEQPGHCALKCPAGQYYDATQIACLDCQPGYFTPDANYVQCLPCAAGTFNGAKKGITCDRCPVGTYSESGSATCSSCGAGFIPDKSQGGCDACGKGSYAKAGDISCSSCPLATYQDQLGKASCTPCPEGRTTEFLASTGSGHCLCKAGHYSADPQASCQTCPTGVTCLIGSDITNWNKKRTNTAHDASLDIPRNYPMLGKRYFAFADNPTNVFRCLTDEACPGGDPGSCGANSGGIACGACDTDYYRADDGSCSKCSGLEMSNFLFPVIPLLLGPPIIIALFKKGSEDVKTWNSPKNNIKTVLFLALIYTQMLAVISHVYILKPSTMATATDWSGYTFEYLSVLRPECGIFSDFKGGFIGKLLAPVYVLIMFLIVWLVSKIACGSWGTANGDVIFCGFWSVYNTFFMAIAEQTFSLFQCYEHVNGERSMRAQPDVLCGSDTWNQLVAFAVLAILFFCVAAFSLFAYIIGTAHKKFADERFRTQWKFLFLRFRPSVQWWALLILTKGVWLDLTTVFFDKGTRQLVWMMSGVLVYLVASLHFLPWRSTIAGYVDSLSHVVILILFAFLPYFSFPEESDSDDDTYASAYAVISMVPYLGIVAAAVTLAKFWMDGENPAHKEINAAIEAMSNDFQRVGEAPNLADCLKRLAYHDYKVVAESHGILAVELLAQLPQKKLSRRLTETKLTNEGIERVPSKKEAEKKVEEEVVQPNIEVSV